MTDDTQQLTGGIMDALHLPMHVVDRDLVLRHVNQAMCSWCEQLGLTGVVPGARLQDAFPFLGPMVEQEYQQVFVTGEPLVTQEASDVQEEIVPTETRKLPLRVDGEVTQVLTVISDLGPRLHVEQALRSSELRYHAIVASSPMGMHFYTLADDDRLVFTGANPAADRLLQVDHQQFVGKTIGEAFPALTGTEIPDACRNVVRSGKTWKAEQLAYEDDQIAGAFDVIAFRSGPGHLTVFFLEVTARRRAEAERAHLLAILEYTSDMVATANPDRKVLYLNRAGAELLGWSNAEIPRKEIGDAHPPEALELLRRVGLPAAIKHGLWSGETALYGANGETIPVSQVIMAHRSESGKLAYYSTVIRDLRHARQVERSLQLQRDLGLGLGACDTLEEVLYLSLVGILSIAGMDAGGVYLVDPETGGLNLEQSQGLPDDFVSTVSRIPADSPQAALVLGGDPIFAHYDEIGYPSDKVRNSAGLRAFAGLPIRHAGQVIACVNMASYTRDAISDLERRTTVASLAILGEAIGRKLAEAALRRSEQQLVHAQRMETVGRLAGGVAHDFNNLLAAIQVTCELMEEEIPAGTQLREDLDQIMETSERGAGLVRQLLAFSAHKATQPSRILINDAVRLMHKMLRRIIGENIELRVVLGEDIGYVEADPSQLDQVLVNLSVNAVEAMPDGGTLTVTTQRRLPLAELPPDHEAAEAYVVLRVQDTGHGMPDDIQELIFEPFFSTKDSTRGTGLGLAIVYSVARESGGFVTVKTAPEAGAIFELWLPESAAAPRASDPVSPPPRERALGTETILVVEDDAVLLRQTSRVLEQHGYQVLPAASGAEALQLVQEGAPPIHLLLSDIVMPGTTGIQLAETLIQLRPELRVLLMSGHIDPELLQRSVTSKTTAFLPKPFDAKTLIKMVREVLDG